MHGRHGPQSNTAFFRAITAIPTLHLFMTFQHQFFASQLRFLAEAMEKEAFAAPKCTI
jgi:hypothetical protein